MRENDQFIRSNAKTAMLMLVNGLRITLEIRFDAGQASLVISLAEENSILGNPRTLVVGLDRSGL